MELQDIIGELLYIGIVAEKGRCYGIRWRFGYKKILRRHLMALNELQKCLQSIDVNVAYIKIKEFVLICKKNYEIGKFYNFTNKQVDEIDIGKSYKNVNQLINKLFFDLMLEINKPYIHKRRVYDLLCALHNLPRVYLGRSKETLCDLKQETIQEQEAIEYAFKNMNFTMKRKYQDYI